MHRFTFRELERRTVNLLERIEGLGLDDAQDGDTRLYEVEKAVDACVAALKAFIVS